MIEEKELHDAIDRIARSADGHKLYLFLQRAMMAVPASEVSDYALRRHAGERLFAAKLIGLMAKGIADSGGHSDSIYTFAVAGPVAVARPSGAGRRVTIDTHTPGYSNPDNPGTG